MTETNWTVPETDVLQHARDLLAADRPGVLATIIAVEGSAYRRPGAKMLIPEGGEGFGHITAGCLEGEVQELAAEVLAAGEPRVEHYDLTPGGEADVWGLGVGCNGIIDILLEPLDATYAPVLDALERGEAMGVATVVTGDDRGARAYYDPETESFERGDGFPADVADAIRAVTADLTARGKADSVDVDGVTVFVDGVRPPKELVVLGTGHDVTPIVELGKQADFRVTVVAFRGAMADPERFPAADAVVATSPASVREVHDFDADTSVVVATHNFIDDRIAVDELLRTDVGYVGLMGPRKRFEEMLAEFDEEGRTFSDDELARLYTPIGLDLGGGTPQQIALSIVSEVLAVANDRTPGHLKAREGHIHERADAALEPPEQ